MGLHDLGWFVLAGLILNLTPGPDTLFITQRTALGGWRHGVAACWGIAAGLMVHAIAAAAGLSALIAASEPAFVVLRTLGALYLLYLGWQMTRAPSKTAAQAVTADAQKVATWQATFFQAVGTNILNPKVILFFLSFVPQFVDAQAPDREWGYLALGVLFVFTSMLWCHLLVWMVQRARTHWRLPARLSGYFQRVLGLAMVGLGVRLFFVQRP